MANSAFYPMLGDPFWRDALQALTVPASPLQELAWQIMRYGALGVPSALSDYINEMFEQGRKLESAYAGVESQVLPRFLELIGTQVTAPKLTEQIEQIEPAMERMLQRGFREISERLGERLSRSGAFTNIAAEALKDLIAQTALRKAEMATSAKQQEFANLMNLLGRRADLLSAYSGLATELAKGRTGAALMPYETSYHLQVPFLEMVSKAGTEQRQMAETGLERALKAWSEGKYWTTGFPVTTYTNLLRILLSTETAPKYAPNQFQELLSGLMQLNLLQQMMPTVNLSTPASQQPKR